jgi:hypothetical protein
VSPTIELSPPPPEACLETSRVSRYWGGTLIAEDVVDVEEHRRRMADPDRYRPVPCPRCGGVHVHVHGRALRRPRGDPSLPRVIEVLQFLCVECRATWRVLPRFLARHLWHPWRVVEASTLEGGKETSGPPISEGTKARWASRLGSAARKLVVVLAASGAAMLEQMARQVGLNGQRRELVETMARSMGLGHGERLSVVGAVLHRLERGLRLM